MLNTKLNPREPKKRKLVTKRHIWEEESVNTVPTHHLELCGSVVSECYLVSPDDEIWVKVELKRGDDVKLLKQQHTAGGQ